jgi:hypothetical protein
LVYENSDRVNVIVRQELESSRRVSLYDPREYHDVEFGQRKSSRNCATRCMVRAVKAVLDLLCQFYTVYQSIFQVVLRYNDRISHILKPGDSADFEAEALRIRNISGLLLRHSR